MAELKEYSKAVIMLCEHATEMACEMIDDMTMDDPGSIFEYNGETVYHNALMMMATLIDPDNAEESSVSPQLAAVLRLYCESQVKFTIEPYRG